MRIVGLGQEDESLESARQILDSLSPRPSFPIAADIARSATGSYDRTTAYLVDRSGSVRQIFPMMTHMRATARVLLKEIDRLSIGER